jgi:hypothetical protein
MLRDRVVTLYRRLEAFERDPGSLVRPRWKAFEVDAALSSGHAHRAIAPSSSSSRAIPIWASARSARSTPGGAGEADQSPKRPAGAGQRPDKPR